MGRPAALLSLCILVAALPACGEPGDDAPVLLEAEARPDPAEEPTLAGRGGEGEPAEETPAGVRRELGRSYRGPPAHVDDHGRITIPAHATWGAVQAALRLSAERRRERARLLTGKDGVLVELPGVAGRVVVDGRIDPDASALRLELRAPPGGLDATAVGIAWAARYGCEARVRWTADTWSPATWHEALARLAGIVTETEHGIRIAAHPEIPADEVLPFVAAAVERDLGAVHVNTRPERRFEDPAQDAGSWLSMHQTRHGAWSDGVAPGICGGHRMRDAETGREVEVRGDPDTVQDAGLTGLSLLAFLGAGYTHRGKHAYARTVSRGLRHLKTVQRPDGRFPGAEDWDPATAHGLAALAMVEAYGTTASPIYAGSAQRALDALRQAWYAAVDDALPTAMTAMAFASAAQVNADARARGKPQPLRLDAGLRELLLADVRRLDPGGGNLAAACALLTRILLEEDARKDAEVAAGALRLAESLAETGSAADPMLLWLATLVCFQAEKEPWKRMKRVLGDFVVRTQRKDGHPCCRKGSWDPRPGASLPGGRVAATAACTICLLVYYRYDRVFGTR